MTVNVVQDFDEAALADLVHEYFDVPRDQLHAAATLDELGLDSLALMELMVVLEDRSGIELLDQLHDLSLASTLRDAARVIKSAADSGSPCPAPAGQHLPTPRDGG